jgi:hypothetical protein
MEKATGVVAFTFYFQSSKLKGIDWQVFCGKRPNRSGPGMLCRALELMCDVISICQRDSGGFTGEVSCIL